MKLEFSKNSWHYWFVNKTTSYFSYGREASDICSYTRAFIVGVLKTVFLGSVATAATACVLSTFAWGLSKLFGFGLPELILALGRGGLVILLVVATLAAIVGMIALSDHIKEKRTFNPKPPGAIKEMYSSWKNKTCKQIEFN
jgi:hypothetical protein